ncbi:ABC transporter ATP-binding protein [soil metagenome]
MLYSAPAVDLHDVTLAYRRRPAIHHVSGRFEPASLTAIVGPNGAGKSTLLKGIVGALRPDSGSIRLSGIDRRAVAYLPQINDIDRSFPVTVLDLVATGVWREAGAFRRIAGPPLHRLQEAIAAVGLTGLEHRTIGTLSGGQMQRALFARLLLQDSKLLLLDEPFTAIDGKTTADLLALIHRWHGQNRTIIAVLHDIDLVREHFPETLVIARELVAWGPTAETLNANTLREARRKCDDWEDSQHLCERDAA